MMRPRIARIRALAHALGNVEVHSAAESVEVALAGNALLNIVPPVRQYVSPTRLAAVELHECGHAKSASISGWAITKVFVRPDGTGNCLCERNADTDYASSLELVRFLLAGYASELRYPYASSVVSPSSFDIMNARLALDDLNVRNIGPRVSFAEASARAVTFVDQHARSISNLALALHSVGDLDGHEVRLFGRSDA